MQGHLHKSCRLHNLWVWSLNYFSKNRNLLIPWLVFVFTVTSILWKIDFLLNTHVFLQLRYAHCGIAGDWVNTDLSILDKNHFREWRKVGTLLKKLRWSWSSLCIDFVSCENLYFGYIELSESFDLFLCPYVFCVIKMVQPAPEWRG